MVPQMEQVVGVLPVTIQTCGGMDSVTAKYRLAQLCAERDTTILHVGDWDPGGISIYHGIALDVGAMVREMAENTGGKRDFSFVRVGVLPEHVNAFGLLTGATKSGDADKGWYPGINGDQGLTCQAEAFPPDVLEAVEAEVDMSEVARLEVAEIKDRVTIQKAMEGIEARLR